MTNCGGSASCYAITGMRFRPLDEELISYLLKFVSGKPFECDHIIDNVDLYGNKKPCDIFDKLSPEGEATDVNYFFTQLKRKSVNGKNFISTMVGGRTWKVLDKGKGVLDKIKRSTIGHKKTLRFDDHNDEDQQYVWRMKEYCLSDKILTVLRKRGQILREDFILCRIKRKLVDQKKGFCAINNSENIITGLCSNIHMVISSSGDHENIVVDSSEQPMIGYVEDQNQYVDSISCASNISENDQFQQQQEFERAKASVAPVDETLHELSNLLNENEDYYSLLSSFTTESDINDPMSQTPHLISTDDQFSEQATMITSNGLSIMSDQFQIGCEMQIGNYEKTATSPLYHSNCNSSSSALMFSSGVEYCFPMDQIYTVDDLPCCHKQTFDDILQDLLTKQGDKYSTIGDVGEVNPNNDIVSYHNALDSYAAAKLKRHSPSVPEATQLLDQ